MPLSPQLWGKQDGKNKSSGSFPRDSSATLGMTESKVLGMTLPGVDNGATTNRKRAYKLINGTYIKVFCHVEQAKRVETSRGSVTGKNVFNTVCPVARSLSSRGSVT